MSEKILLIDGYSILHRAFYGLPDLTNAKGFHTNAIYGFLNILFRLLEEEHPKYLAVAFDVHEPTFRHAIFPDYKGTRKPMPEELRMQIPVFKELLRAMNIACVEQPGLEADDILGTLAKKAAKEGYSVSLVSGDRDLLQIADENILIRIPKTKSGKTEIEDYTPETVRKTYGVNPSVFIQLKALMGDAGDNVAGVPKVGEKTATALLVEYGSIDGIYEHLEDISKNAIRESLRTNRDVLDLALTLVTIKTDAELGFSFKDAKIGNFYTEKAFEMMQELGFKNFLSRFDLKAPVKEFSYEIVDSDELFSRWLSAVSFSEQSPLAVYPAAGGIALCSGEDRTVFVKGSESLWKPALEAVAKDDFRAVVFGIKNMYDEYPFLTPENSFDTLLAFYLLNPLLSNYSAEDLGTAFLDSPGPVYAQIFGKLEPEQAFLMQQDAYISYAAHNAHAIYDSYFVLKEKLEKTGQIDLFRTIEMPLSLVLYHMQKEGVRVNPTELREYGETLSVRICELEREILSEAGEEFNINSPKQLGTVLFEKMNLPGGKKTKSGYSTAADVLEKLAADYPFVRKILEYRTLTKLKSTYADGLAAFIDSDHRIRSTFHQTVTATGRISSADPNLQNIPIRTDIGRKLRKIFIPKEGWKFTDADYSQIELRVLASMSGDEELIAAYKSASDIHRITASKVFHVPMEEVTELQRRNAKAVNFGIVYGISSFGLSQDLSISKKEAEGYIKEYFKTYPGIKEFLDRSVSEAKENGYSRTLSGRRRPIPELSSSNFMQRSFGERVAMNAPVQGTAADIIKIAMISVDKNLREEGLQSRLVLQVHDELLVETAPGEEERVAAIIEDGMKHAMDLAVELEIDMHLGNNWYEAH